MADFKKLWMRDRIKTNPRVTTENISPSVGWTEDSESHKLLIDLPGFKKSDIKLKVDESGAIVVSGKRKVSDSKRMQFEKTVKAPEDADVVNLGMKFVGDTLQVSMPKVVKEKDEEPKPQNAAMSADSGNENRGGFEGSREAKEKEEAEIQNEAPSKDLRDKKEVEPEPEPQLQKEAPESDLRSKSQAKEMEESEAEPQKDPPNSDLRDEAQAKEMEEPGPESQKEASDSDLRDEPRTKKMNEPDPGPQDEDLRGDLREETESTKASKDQEEPGIQNAASSTNSRDEEMEKGKVIDKIEEPEAKGDMTKDESEELKKHQEEDGQDGHENERKIRSSTDQGHGENGKENVRNEEACQKSIFEKMVDQRAILLASIISFTLGVLLSPKFSKPQQK